MSEVGKIPVSVLILTLNEATNIERCLAALSFSDDIVVLDSYSSDDTVQLAEAAGARTFQREFDDFASQRNFALDNIDFEHDWVLHLDADEVVTPEVRDEIASTISNPHFAAYRMTSKLIFGDSWLRYSGMFPVYQVRLGRKDALRFEQVGHGQRESLNADQVGTLKSAYLHYGFSKGMADWIERHNRYSSDEAGHHFKDSLSAGSAIGGLFSLDRTERRRAVKQLVGNLPFRPFARFLYMYVLKLGFLDGRAGWTYCRLMAMYEYWINLKRQERLSDHSKPFER
jgi:glycosyltransferase involved in cell wall biosynthesis